MPTRAWALIGVGFVGAVVAAFLAGQRRRQRPGEPPTGDGPASGAPPPLPAQPPPSS